MKSIIIASFAVLLAAYLCFFQKPKKIAQAADYEQFITIKHHEEAQSKLASQISFWENKLAASPGNFVFEKRLAGLLAASFKRSGKVENLHRSDSLLQSVNRRLPGQVGVLQSLAANAINRHAFREAEGYLTEAFDIGEKQYSTSLMLADVQMERGNLVSAEYLLNELGTDGHFDFLVRQMKFHDQSGDLGSAISSMEKAAALAKASGKSGLINWSLSNLGDMYGHDGRIQKSYDTFLEALAYDPADLHSLRGIAWIAFSHDHNLAEAKRILLHLKSIHPVPDYDFLLAQIYEVEGNETLAKWHQDVFVKNAGVPKYGNMYKAYICEIISGTPAGLAIAEAEVAERPHPKSYDLLAWANFQNGNPKVALKIIEDHVLEQTSEPITRYHAGMILAANGKSRQAKKCLQQALDAEFELGPGFSSTVF